MLGMGGVETMNVYIIVYTDNGFVSDPVGRSIDLSNQLMQNLTLGTAYHGYKTHAATSYLGWKPYDGVIHAIPGKVPQFSSGLQQVADYTQIFDQVSTQFNTELCSLINQGQIQEIWIWADRTGQLRERIAVGPSGGYTTPPEDISGRNVKDCTPADGIALKTMTEKQYAIMGFNTERDVAQAMESYAHHLEDAFHVLFPCEFDVPNDFEWPWQDPLGGFGQLRNDCAGTRGFTARSHALPEPAQCGNAHWSPNVKLDDEIKGATATPVISLEYYGYDRADLGFINGCADWAPQVITPTPAPTVTCLDGNAWNCMGNSGSYDDDKRKFHVWWMQNIPGANNGLKKCDGTTNMENWWVYLRGDSPNPNEESHPEWRCNVSLPSPALLAGQVFSDKALNNAAITIYTLEPKGVLSPVILNKPIFTVADGSYISPALPIETNGKTLVVQATTRDYSLYSLLPQVNLNRPLKCIITPFTDISFRLAQYTLKRNPNASPEYVAFSYNSRVAMMFGLISNQGSPFGSEPFNFVSIPPANIYDGKHHAFGSPETVYAIALAGLSQQAADTGMSQPDWVTLFAADADDGIINGTAKNSAQLLSNAINRFLTSPNNPLHP